MKTAHDKYLGLPAASWQRRDDYLTNWLGDLLDVIKAYWGRNLRELKLSGDQITLSALNAGGRTFTATMKANEKNGVIRILVTQEGKSSRRDFPSTAKLGEIVEGIDLTAMSLLPKGWRMRASATRVAAQVHLAAIDWEDLAYRLNRFFGNRHGDAWGYKAEDLQDDARQGNPIVDIGSNENDPQFRKLEKAFPELDFRHWWDYGAMSQKEWFITGDLKRGRLAGRWPGITNSPYEKGDRVKVQSDFGAWKGATGEVVGFMPSRYREMLKVRWETGPAAGEVGDLSLSDVSVKKL